MTLEPADRLMWLGMARAALAWMRIGSVEEYRRASRAQLAHLGDHGPPVRRLIRQGRLSYSGAVFATPIRLGRA